MTELRVIDHPTDAPGNEEPVTRPAPEAPRRRLVTVFGAEDELLTFEETAQLFGCTVSTVRRRLEDPSCVLKPIYPTPGRPFILRSTISAHLESLMTPTPVREPVNAPDLTPVVIPAPKRRNRKP